jgi:hypothetical protein
VAKQVRKVIVSHIGTNPETQKQMIKGELEVELVPQGTLAERIRAGGYGLGGVITPTGLGTMVAEGKQTIELNGSGQGSARPNTRPAQYVQLTAQNGSGMTGRVALNAGERPNITQVLVGLDKPSHNTSYFANMYFGTCSAPGEVPYKLSKVENGRSVTNLPLAFQVFIDENGAAYRGPYAILVSRTANPGSSLACGDLKGPDRAPIQKPSPDKQGSGKADARSIDLVGSKWNHPDWEGLA